MTRQRPPRRPRRFSISKPTLAKASTKRDDLRDPVKIYHRMDLAQARRASRRIFPGTCYFREMGAPESRAQISASPISFRRLMRRFRLGAARRLENLSSLASDSHCGAGAARQIRGGKFQFLRQDAHRDAGDASAVAAVRAIARTASLAKLSGNITCSAISRRKRRPARWRW